MSYSIIQKLSSTNNTLRWLSERHSVILTLLLIVSVALNAVLTLRLNGVIARLNRLTAQPTKRYALKSGMIVPAFTAKANDGQDVTVSYNESQKPTILYFLSTSCSWCEYNIMNLKKLGEVVGDRYRVLVMSILSLPATPSASDLQSYRDRIAKYNDLKFTIYDAPSQVKDEYLLIEVPATVVVSPKGEVLKVWFGPYRGNIRREIEEYFGIKLPGIAEIQ